MVTFVQHVSDAQVQTKCLSVQNLLEHHSSASSDAIVDMLTQEIDNDKLQWGSLAGLASYGASVFTSSKNEVGVKLTKKQDASIDKGRASIMQQLWCICHRLALACSNANDSANYVSVVENNLLQLWSLFENSNKTTALYAKVQMNLNKLTVNERTRKVVTCKIQKACHRRWLSLGKAVKSLKEDYPAVLTTLKALAAKGLFMQLNTIKFIGAIYILKCPQPQNLCSFK